MRRRGSTLIETLYSCVLLSLVTLFVLNLYPGSFVAIKRGESTLQAEMFSQTILEDLKSRSFGNLQIGAPPAYLSQTYGGIEYDPTVQLQAYDSISNTSLLMAAVVTVSWTYKGSLHNVTHEMLLANVTR